MPGALRSSLQPAAPADPCAQMRPNKLPPGWNEEQVQRVLAHYESQTDEEAVAEDEAAYEDSGDTLTEIPYKSAPIVRNPVAQTSSAEHAKKLDV